MVTERHRRIQFFCAHEDVFVEEGVKEGVEEFRRIHGRRHRGWSCGLGFYGTPVPRGVAEFDGIHQFVQDSSIFSGSLRHNKQNTRTHRRARMPATSDACLIHLGLPIRYSVRAVVPLGGMQQTATKAKSRCFNGGVLLAQMACFIGTR